MVKNNGFRVALVVVGLVYTLAGCVTSANASDSVSNTENVIAADESPGEEKSSGRRKPSNTQPRTLPDIAPENRGEVTHNELWPIEGWNVADLMPDASYLTQLEREVILHLNMARTNPARYADEFIEPMIQYFNGTLYREPGGPSNFAGIQTREGVRAVEECVRVMRRATPVGALRPSEGASRGAEDHAKDQSRTGDTGHTGSDGSTPSGRMERYGDWIRTMGENIAYGPSDPRQIVVNLLVDDGVPSRGHRDNILNGDFQVVGVAVETHPVYRYVCVMGYAGGFQEGR